MQIVRQLTEHFSQHGRLDAIYLRPGRGQPCLLQDQVQAIANLGLQGDRASLHSHQKQMEVSDK